MATAPVKPPLHNFPTAFLRWGNGSRSRRPISAADGANDSSDAEPPSRRSRAARNRLASCSSSAKDGGSGGDGDGDGDAEAEAEAAAAEQKPWKLRPRKALFSKAQNNGGGGGRRGESNKADGRGGERIAGEGAAEAKSTRLRGFADESSSQQSQQQQQQNFEKMAAMAAEKKRKFWIALSREEIEEDVFIMTGSRPARRPRKRPKNVQKQLDAVFPGLWLVGLNADAYRVAEAQPKR